MFKDNRNKNNKVVDEHIPLEEQIRLLSAESLKPSKTLSPESIDEEISVFNPVKHDVDFGEFRTYSKQECRASPLRVEYYPNSIYLNDEELLRSNIDISKLKLDFSLYESSIYRSLEIATSSISEVVSSSSPSMIVHQMASLMFSMMVNKKTVFEETLGDYTTDILILDDNGKKLFILDTCANIDNKETDLRSKGVKEYLILSKYVMVRNIEDKIGHMLSLSRDCDSRQCDLLFQNVETQSYGEEMIYSKETIDFLVKERKTSGNIDDLTYLRQIVDDKVKSLYRTSFQRSNFTTDITETSNKSRALLLEAMREVDSEYESISFSEIGAISSVASDNDMEKGVAEENKTNTYYEKLSHVRVEGKFRDHTKEDTKSLHLKDLKELYYSESVLKLFKEGIYPVRIQRAYKKAVTRRSGLIESKSDHKLSVKERFINLEKFCMSTLPVSTLKIKKNPFLRIKVEVDPYHKSMFKKYKVDKELESLFSRSREYCDLRMRERVSRALYSSRRPESKFKVFHWMNSRIHAECYIRGLLFEKDKGIAVISFFDNDELIKTEKWHLADVEAYNKGADTLVSVMIGLMLKAKEVKHEINSVTLINMFKIYSKLITENSWGTGAFMKPFRYWTSGICMSSTESEASVRKVIKSLSPSNKSKHSLSLIKNILSNKSLMIGRTAIFDLPYSLIGFECFMVNLTPAKTYGSKRHLRGCITDLYQEIDLSNEHFKQIKEVTMNFEKIIKQENFTADKKRFLVPLVEYHLDMMENLSTKTGGRFTLSPMSIVMISSELDKIPRSLFQKSVPHISELMTTKGSWDSVTSESKMALESISMLMGKLDEFSTTSLLYKILSSNKKKDLYMRMFDKDQVAANREISILSSCFRVLQSVCEQFSRSIGKETGHDMLDNKRKIDLLTSSFENCMKHKNRLFLTIDQTRWGPNFNTCLFGWMHLYLMRRTTEAYIPAMVCLMSEFKVFGAPEELTEIFLSSDRVYSGFGKLGRFHMAQGIFHYTSSLYHSMVNSKQLELIKSTFESEISIPFDLRTNHLVTSDDAAMMLYLTPLKTMSYKIKKSEEVEDIDLPAELSSLKSICKIAMKKYYLFNILTSEYKNIFSESMIEFNSFYLSDDHLGSNDFKYLNSLLINQTTGSMWEDFRASINSYGDSINSGCSSNCASTIMDINVFRVSKMWRLNLRDSDIDPMYYEKGFPRFTEAQDPEFSFGDRSRLRFKKRDSVLKSKVWSDNLMTEIINEKIGKISKSKRSENHRTLFIPNLSRSSKEIMIQNPNYSKTEIFIGMSDLINICLSDRDNIYLFYDVENEIPYTETIMESDYPEGKKFVSQVLMKPTDSESSPKEILVSSFNKVESISKTSTNDQIILHMLRRWHTLDIEKTDLELIELYVSLNEETLTRMKGTVRSLKIRRTEEVSHKTLCYSRFLKEMSTEYIPKLIIRCNPEISGQLRENYYKSNYLNYVGTLKAGSNGFQSKRLESGFHELSSSSIDIPVDIDISTLDFTDTIENMMSEENFKTKCYMHIQSAQNLYDSEDESDDGKNIDEMLIELANEEINDSEENANPSAEKIYCTECNPSAIIFAKVWSRNMIIYNKILEILLKTHLVASTDITKDNVSATSTFKKTSQLITSDPELAFKLNNYTEKLKIILKRKYQIRSDEWIDTALWSIGDKTFSQSSAFNFHPKIFFSTEPKGTMVGNENMRDLIAGLEFEMMNY